MTQAEKPLRKDAMRNRRRILDAAQELFAERGLRVSLNDIAHRAGVGVGTVYRHFPDKELLIDALFEQRIGTLVGFAEEGLDQPDPWNGLVLFLERSSAEQAADRGLEELVLGGGHGGDRIEDVRARLKPKVDRLVARAKSAGALHPDLQSVDVPVIQLMIGTAVDLTEQVAPGTWRRYLDLILQGLRRRDDERPALEPPALEEESLSKAMRALVPRSRPIQGPADGNEPGQ